MQRYKNKENKGFTLIELLVVVAIISLLSSLALIALVNARQKSRDTKRVSDMVSMANALELYFAAYKGYPSSTAGIATGLSPEFANTIPKSPMPPDGGCVTYTHQASQGDECANVDGSCEGIPGNTYFYIASGTSYVLGGKTLFPDYAVYFCLGNQTGNFLGGTRKMTPRGMK